MKISTTSPGRAEKYYPTPFLRLLRSNVGSKSRGRTRSSPLLFINRRRSNAGSSSLEVQQEPTSPKVTCMGQVRVKRNARTGPTRRRRRFRWRRCKWVPSEKMTRPYCCVKMRRPAWPKWISFSCTKKRRPEEEEEEEEEEVEEKEEVVEVRSEAFEDEEEEEEGRRARVSDVGFPRSVSPPKNALLLTRSRSAPYRSSSLACRFWGSPLGEEGIVAKKLVINKVEDDDQEEDEEANSTCPTSKREFLSKEEEREEEAGSINPNPTSERVSLSSEEEEEACSSSPTSKRSSLSKEEEREEEEEGGSSGPTSKRSSLSKVEGRGSTSPTSKRSSSFKEKVLEEEEQEASTTSPTSKRVSLSKEEEEEAPLVASVEAGIVVEEPMPTILTRCKSEPVRTGVDKLGRRLGFT